MSKRNRHVAEHARRDRTAAVIVGGFFVSIALLMLASAAFAVAMPVPVRQVAKAVDVPMSSVTEIDGRREQLIVAASRDAERARIEHRRQVQKARARAEAKAEAARQAAQPSTPVSSYPVSGNRALGQKMMLTRWGIDQWGCLDALWTRESGWNHHAYNSSSGAFGIPQALPGSKMASAGSDWQTNPATQIEWGLGYIAARYGSPCSAWAHSQSTGWY